MRTQEPVSSQLKKLVIDLRLHGYPERLQGHRPELLEDVVVKLISQVEEMERTELTVSELIDHLMCQVEDLKKLIASKKLKNSKA